MSFFRHNLDSTGDVMGNSFTSCSFVNVNKKRYFENMCKICILIVYQMMHTFAITLAMCENVELNFRRFYTQKHCAKQT